LLTQVLTLVSESPWRAASTAPAKVAATACVTFWAAALDAKEEPLSEASSKVYRRLRLPDPDLLAPAPALAGLTGPGPAPLSITALLHQGSPAALGCSLRVSSLRCRPRRGS
jgi:hypothetical protein